MDAIISANSSMLANFIFNSSHLLIVFCQATNNIIVLAREESGAEKIVRENGIFFLHKMAQVKDDFELQQASYRALANLAENSRKRVSDNHQCLYFYFILYQLKSSLKVNTL